MKKEKSELEKELVYKPIYLPVRFFKKEAYIHIDDYKEAINKRENVVNELEEENRKLSEKIGQLEFDVDAWHQLKLLLEWEIEKLKSDLEECECSFWFESDEVWFWEREYKRLKKWIKDHCKGYWNLFPEDEMKRQWKKADKKRK